MGMYTTLRFAAPLSADGLVVVQALQLAQKAKYDSTHAMSSWRAVAGLLTNMSAYLAHARKDFIPFGAVQGGGDSAEWDDDRNEVQDDVWYVVCSLKDYDDTIAVFLRDVLPQLISHSCRAGTWYEEDERPREHIIHPQEVDRNGP